jgi:hypothetical protein
MKFEIWELPIQAEAKRSIELKKLEFSGGGLSLTLAEENTDDIWAIVFKSVQAFRSTTEECSARILETLPLLGGFFKTSNSAWMDELGKGDIVFLSDSNHFIICCYDEVIEVVADVNSVEVTKLPVN